MSMGASSRGSVTTDSTSAVAGSSRAITVPEPSGSAPKNHTAPKAASIMLKTRYGSRATSSSRTCPVTGSTRMSENSPSTSSRHVRVATQGAPSSMSSASTLPRSTARTIPPVVGSTWTTGPRGLQRDPGRDRSRGRIEPHDLGAVEIGAAEQRDPDSGFVHGDVRRMAVPESDGLDHLIDRRIDALGNGLPASGTDHPDAAGSERDPSASYPPRGHPLNGDVRELLSGVWIEPEQPIRGSGSEGGDPDAARAVRDGVRPPQRNGFDDATRHRHQGADLGGDGSRKPLRRPPVAEEGTGGECQACRGHGGGHHSGAEASPPDLAPRLASVGRPAPEFRHR